VTPEAAAVDRKKINRAGVVGGTRRDSVW